MDSVWFSVHEDSDFESGPDSLSEGSSPFMGVFNQRPEEIARWLPRPKTPFMNTSVFQPNFIPNKMIDEQFAVQRGTSQPDSLAGISSLNKASVSAVSVF